MELNNPAYQTMLKLGKSVRFTKPTLELPMLESRQLVSGDSHVNLYDDQFDIYIQAKNHTTCLTEAQTGFGKTVLAIALHESWGGRTLVACHSLVLAKQFAAEFKKFIGVEPTFYCDGKHDQTGMSLSPPTLPSGRSTSSLRTSIT